MRKLYKYYVLFKEDRLGTMFFLITLIKRETLAFIYKPFIWILKIKGCHIEPNCRFYNSTLVERFPKSTIRIGNNCVFVSTSLINYRGISHKCIINTGAVGAEIIIGDNCGFSGVSIVANKSVRIGNHVTVGADTIIGDRDDHSELYPSEPRPVVIEDNVWIGMHCIILKGVHIGENTIIGAGSIVTKDIPANSIAAGVPCKVIKSKN